MLDETEYALIHAIRFMFDYILNYMTGLTGRQGEGRKEVRAPVAVTEEAVAVQGIRIGAFRESCDRGRPIAQYARFEDPLRTDQWDAFAVEDEALGQDRAR